MILLLFVFVYLLYCVYFVVYKYGTGRVICLFVCGFGLLRWWFGVVSVVDVFLVDDLSLFCVAWFVGWPLRFRFAACFMILFAACCCTLVDRTVFLRFCVCFAYFELFWLLSFVGLFGFYWWVLFLVLCLHANLGCNLVVVFVRGGFCGLLFDLVLFVVCASMVTLVCCKCCALIVVLIVFKCLYCVA